MLRSGRAGRSLGVGGGTGTYALVSDPTSTRRNMARLAQNIATAKSTMSIGYRVLDKILPQIRMDWRAGRQREEDDQDGCTMSKIVKGSGACQTNLQPRVFLNGVHAYIPTATNVLRRSVQCYPSSRRLYRETG